MKETLFCNRCEKKWKRDKVRGRKPYYCPPCTEEVSLNLQTTKPSFSIKKIVVNPEPNKVLTSLAKPKTAKQSDLIQPPSHWQCPSCKVYIGVEVAITTPPVHKCVKKAKRLLALERISKRPPKQK